MTSAEISAWLREHNATMTVSPILERYQELEVTITPDGEAPLTAMGFDLVKVASDALSEA